jgi:poly(glycerol-phosphate) alpha-glucosyltransferase
MNNANELVGGDSYKTYPKKILFLSNLPTPYQLDFFDEVNHNHSVLSIFLWKKEENRDWTLSERPWIKTLADQVVEPSWQKLSTQIKDFMPDAVIVGGYKLPLANRLKFYCLTKNIPYFYWLEKPLPSEWWKRLLRSIAWRFTLPFASGIFGIDSEAVRVYGRYNKNCVKLPYSIDVSKYVSPQKKNAKAPIRCIYVGQFIERKGLNELLNAFSLISNDSATLTLAGSGVLSPLVGEYCHKYNHIRDLGFVNPSDLPLLFSEYDLFILPSKHDGWAVVIAEAMACGLPVIGTSSTGAFADLVIPNKCGIECLVNSESIRNAILFYVNNPKSLDKHGDIAKEVVVESLANSKNAAKKLIDTVFFKPKL